MQHWSFEGVWIASFFARRALFAKFELLLINACENRSLSRHLRTVIHLVPQFPYHLCHRHRPYLACLREDHLASSAPALALCAHRVSLQQAAPCSLCTRDASSTRSSPGPPSGRPSCSRCNVAVLLGVVNFACAPPRGDARTTFRGFASTLAHSPCLSWAPEKDGRGERRRGGGFVASETGGLIRVTGTFSVLVQVYGFQVRPQGRHGSVHNLQCG